jgi:predicted nucleic acid-binding protein
VREAVTDYLDLPLLRHGHQALMARVLELRENFSAYDATYVALAEQLDGALLTSDRRFGRAITTFTKLLRLP